MEGSIIIREMSGEVDVNLWLKIRKERWPLESYDELKNADYLRKTEKFTCFFAESDQELVGFVEIALRPHVNGCNTSPVAFVEGIWVHENFQKKSIGRLLINRCEQWAKTLFLKELASDTRIESEQSIYAHKSWGFQETERIVHFKKDL